MPENDGNDAHVDWRSKARAIFTNADDRLKYLFLFFAVWELLPKHGVWAPTVLGIILLVDWFYNRRHRILLNSWRAGTNVLKDWPAWWKPVLAILMIAIAWTLVALDRLHVTIGRPNYLYEHTQLDIEGADWAHEQFPLGRASRPSNEREQEKDDFFLWKHWMSQGAKPPESLSWVRSKAFDDDYADFDAILTIDSSHTIHHPIAFLVKDAPGFENDPNYRPRSVR